MPDDHKRDPFKPPQPAIPGVPADQVDTLALPPTAANRAAAKPADHPRPGRSASAKGSATLAEKLGGEMMPILMGFIALAIFTVMAVVWKSKRSSSADDEVQTTTTAPAAAPADSTPAPLEPANQPVAPGVIAKAGELSEPWAAKYFIYHNDATGRSTPAMVVHLPRGGYWGFSLIEPYGRCRLEYVTDLRKLAKDYQYPADHPLIADPCSHTLFDLLRYGGPMNGEVRGDIVYGSAMRPPIAIEIETRGKDVWALKMEE